MLKLADLAARPDMKLGPILVSPSRRRVEGPAGTVTLEPRIMQVFLLLLDGVGRVVTRNELFDEAWGGAMVGDDSINRAIGKVRRVAAETAPGFFEVETIPRTGYRLTGPILEHLGQSPADESGRDAGGLSRRALLSRGAAGVAIAGAAAAGVGLWSIRSREDRQFRQLMEDGEKALHMLDPAANPGQYFRRAVAIRPDSAGAHGRLAYTEAMRAEQGAREDANEALHQAQRSSRMALELNPSEPYALLAASLLERSNLDFAASEASFRRILAGAPDNVEVMRHLWNLMQSVGRSREALGLVERSLEVAPLAAGSHFPRAQLLWILGRNAEADRVIDRAMEYWPSHRWVRFARFTIFAFTGRPSAALAMLENPAAVPQLFSQEGVALWKTTLPALDGGSPAEVAAARRANLEAAQRNLRLSSQAVMTLSALGDVDAAFEVANALFVVSPGDVRSAGPTNRPPANSTAWRFTPWLFTPPTAALRADPRFAVLCDSIGLTDYWARRGVKPDYQLGIV